MGFLRRIAGVFGLNKEEPHESNEEQEDHHHQHPHQHPHHHQQQYQPQPHHQSRGETRRPSQGFRVQVPVAVDKVHIGPLLTPCLPGEGGVQGLRWYARRLRMDEDGDVADEFLDEVFPEVVEMSSGADNRRAPPKFEVKYTTRPAKVRKQKLSVDGKIHQSVEYQGKLQWV